MKFLTVVFLAICAGLGYYMWKKSQKDRQKQIESAEPVKPYKKDELRIENVGPGAVIHLTGIGPEMDEFDIKVISKHTYRQGESSWYEFECDKGTDKVWIDMEEDDELELAVCLRKLKLRDLGISKEDLVRMDDDEEGSFELRVTNTGWKIPTKPSFTGTVMTRTLRIITIGTLKLNRAISF